MVDTVEHCIDTTRTIHIHRVPHYRCLRCDEMAYVVGEGVIDNALACLKYAYRNGMDEMDYLNWCDGKYEEENEE